MVSGGGGGWQSLEILGRVEELGCVPEVLGDPERCSIACVVLHQLNQTLRDLTWSVQREKTITKSEKQTCTTADSSF